MACSFSGDYEQSLAHYEDGLSLDSNSVSCLWQSAVAFDRVQRFEEELARASRAVGLSRRGVLMVSFEYRALMRLGRRTEAAALMVEIRARAETEYIADSLWLTEALFEGDDAAIEAAIEAALRRNIECATGPTMLGLSVDAELAALLPDPAWGRWYGS
ncbi:hypothetical protein BH11GEM2_BH11GEM2_00360 [soil metagenome]